MKKTSRLPGIAAVIVLISLYLPLVFMIFNSVNNTKYGSTWNGFTVKWYVELIHGKGIWEAVSLSLMIGFVSTLVSTVLGVLSAIAIHRFRNRRQAAHYLMVYMPLVIPDILLGIGLLLLFVRFHVDLGIATIIIAHITFSISYVAMVVLGRLQNFDFTMIDAALDLGASQWKAAWSILIPLITPGILSGALIAFTLSMDDFVITFFVAGPGVTTLPVYIYGMMKYGSLPVISALSVVLLFGTVALILLSQKLTGEI